MVQIGPCPPVNVDTKGMMAVEAACIYRYRYRVKTADISFFNNNLLPAKVSSQTPLSDIRNLQDMGIGCHVMMVLFCLVDMCETEFG